MEVIVHLPKSKEQQQEPKKRVATIHAQAVLEYIRRLECPLEQKLALIKAVQNGLREEMKQNI